MESARHRNPARAGLLILVLISLSALIAGRAGAAETITIDPESFDFGAKHVGGEQVQPGDFTVTNDGDGAVELGLATTLPVESFPFRISPVGDYCSFETLDPGESCTIVAVFDPEDAGDFTGSLVIPSDAPGGPTTAALTGLAYPRLLPDVLITPSPVDFGRQGIGTPAERTVEVKNTGEGDMALGVSSIGGKHAGEFRITEDRCDGIVMAAGSVCRIDLAFTPGTAGIREAVLDVPTDVEGADTAVPLTGVGLGIAPDPDPDPDPDPLPGTASLEVGPGQLVAKGWKLSVPVTCAVQRMDRCGGSLELRAGKGTGFTAGRTGYSLSPGKGAVKVKLKPRAVRVLRRAGRLKVRLVVRVEQGSGGPASHTVKRTVRRRAA